MKRQNVEYISQVERAKNDRNESSDAFLFFWGWGGHKIKNLSFHLLGAIFGVRGWAKKLFATFILTLPIVLICKLLKFLPNSKTSN